MDPSPGEDLHILQRGDFRGRLNKPTGSHKWWMQPPGETYAAENHWANHWVVLYAYSCQFFKKKAWEFRADVKIDFPQEAQSTETGVFCSADRSLQGFLSGQFIWADFPGSVMLR